MSLVRSLPSRAPTSLRLATPGLQLLKHVRFYAQDKGLENKGRSDRPSINKIGVPFEPFIPLRRSRMPSPISAPKLFLKNVMKKVYLSCYNWVQVYQFKKSMGKGYKPKFLQWKNDSIDSFVKLNTAFAQRKLNDIRDQVADFVYFALAKRQTQLPKNLTLHWDLVKFNKAPKIVTFHAFPHDDGSTLMMQIIYKFETKQRLTFKKRGEKEIKEEIKDLTEYIAFNIDPYTDRIVVAGSVFESAPDKTVRPKGMPSQEETVEFMLKNADIYRIEPKELLELEKAKSG